MRKGRSNLKKANSVLTMLSRINRTIVRAESPDGLFRDACRIAAECGLFDAAWVGLVEPATGMLHTLASAGGIEPAHDALTAPGGLPDTVRRRGEICLYGTPEAVPVEMRCEALEQCGIRVMAGLPLCEEGKVIAVLAVFAAQDDCFDQAVVDLLAEVTDDISFSLDHQLGEQHRLAAESKLHYMASYDAQTGMPNRALLEERLPQLAARAARRGAMLTLLDIRLQRLDRIAQILGPAATDEVMRTVALRMDDCRGRDGLLAQLGHEEFALVSLDAANEPEADALAQEVRRAVEQPVHVDGKEVFLHAAIGGVMYGLHEHDIGLLLRRARAAAKRIDAEDGFQLYTPDLDRDLERHVEMEAELHRALERGEFCLYYQPQLNMKSGVVVGVEALLRWQHPQRGLVPPGQFIPLLEECGLMPRVGTWVLQEACVQAREWQRQGLPPIRMAVNLSAQQFRLADLVATVRQALDTAGLEAQHLELELTESLILENAEQTIQTMHDLKKLGVSLSLDDFGTGYSSLSYLRRYPIDRIKIDQSFVRDMTEHRGSAALVRSILSMAHNLGLATIAEGVETTMQLGYLRKQVCEEMQGFIFSRPLPGSELTQLLREGQRLDPHDSLDEAASTLLVVDEAPGARDAVQRALRREGWNVLAAANASDALALLASHGVGVVMADLHMHGMPGAGFLRRVREMYPDTVRMLFAADPDVASVIDAVNDGDLHKVLRKPMEDSLLRESVRDAFRRHAQIVEGLRLHARLLEAGGR